MIHASFPVVLDANVLIPLTVCDTLLSAAHEGLIQIHWTELILEETRRNLVKAIGLSEEKASRRVAAMKAAFPEAMVTGHEGLISSMTNHEKDRHVLAAAVHVGAQTLVTSNLKDFGKNHLPASLQAQDPDTFLQHLLSQAPDVIMEMLRAQAEALRNPPISLMRLLDGLARSVPGFAREARELLPPSFFK
ncbi:MULTISPECIES: PIN domain-containing protein [unclassified Corallococcus]|uniref:PIN domain-containing protein n=1 Tax=unclassified Corallococcus TaxID=2685029 RepID=UPI001A8C66F7|nr:PIN domain-containing protein [Corallococcus sp. NCRR]MBN9681378.1 PIN domain-containing protein [Corallococcus sp. NCSPR001]WAS87042.1 PIN domain-containing protein [Corallococcus sp. NCRR]